MKLLKRLRANASTYMSVAYYRICQDVVYNVVTCYGVTNRVLTDPFMATVFVTLSSTKTLQ